jgi:predicted nucleic acid-binding protein
MKRIIVIDTNIAFSTFLNVNSRISQVLLNGNKYYDFYAPEYIKTELIEHKDRIKSIGKLDEERFLELFALIMRNIRILNHSLIPKEYYQNAFDICKDIDIDDTAFIAINDFVRGRLWTGDKKLIYGLTSKGYKRIIITNEIFSDFIRKINKQK